MATMPVYMDEAGIPQYLRAMGVPGTEIVDPVQMSWLIEAGLSKYSKYRPMYAGWSLQVNTTDQAYKVPATVHDQESSITYDVMDVADSHYTPSGLASWSAFRSYLPVWWDLSATEFYVYDQPSIGYTWMAQLKHLNSMFEGQWWVEERADGNLWFNIAPKAAVAQVIPVVLRLMRPASRIRKSDMELFHLCVLVEVHRALSSRVGVAQSFSDSGMSIDTGRGVEYHARRAEELEALVNAKFGDFSVVARSG